MKSLHFIVAPKIEPEQYWLSQVFIKLILLYDVGLQKLLTRCSRSWYRTFHLEYIPCFWPWNLLREKIYNNVGPIQQATPLPKWPVTIRLQYILQGKFIFMATSVQYILLYNCVFMVTVITLTKSRNACVSAAPGIRGILQAAPFLTVHTAYIKELCLQGA